MFNNKYKSSIRIVKKKKSTIRCFYNKIVMTINKKKLPNFIWKRSIRRVSIALYGFINRLIVYRLVFYPTKSDLLNPFYIYYGVENSTFIYESVVSIAPAFSSDYGQGSLFVSLSTILIIQNNILS